MIGEGGTYQESEEKEVSRGPTGSGRCEHPTKAWRIGQVGSRGYSCALRVSGRLVVASLVRFAVDSCSRVVGLDGLRNSLFLLLEKMIVLGNERLDRFSHCQQLLPLLLVKGHWKPPEPVD